jgi:formate dehydrogenase iron-sulfur subunit
MQKCDMCRERLARGEVPACVEACPNEACVFGDRDALLREARRRIAAAPDGYLPHIYGEKELGGTSVLYLSDVSLEACGWPEKVGDRALRSYTWPLISKTPLVAGGVAALLTGVYWIIQRRMRLEAERASGQSVETAEKAETAETAEQDGDRT